MGIISKIPMTKPAGIDSGYEFYQIITDFDNPLQIFREAFQNSIDENATTVFCKVWVKKQLGNNDLFIDIWDNGSGLSREKVDCFFGLAKSTKTEPNKTPRRGKLGYKGHGTKIFLNSESVTICTRTKGDEWGVTTVDPVAQIRENEHFCYSNFFSPEELGIQIPVDWETGFYVRIKNPFYFKTQHTWYMLNHMYLRDYIKWFTVFGSIRPLFDTVLKNENIRLYLYGLDVQNFTEDYGDSKKIDPPPTTGYFESELFEIIELGHHFPKERHTDSVMRKYAETHGEKPYFDYYAREIFKNTVRCPNNVSFDFVLYTEGYETKRMYDVLLSRRGKSIINRNMLHTDGERYGLWACKGGVPIEKIDDWITGGKGAGSYTYLHGFVDCDSFELTANRGSIKNTDLEILEIIKQEVNNILESKKIKSDINQRAEIEKRENSIRSAIEDKEELLSRFKDSSRKKLVIPNMGVEIFEPKKLKLGYSESETLIQLMKLLAHYPKLFNFEILDYNTTKGIDFVIKHNEFPKYVELKGSLQSKINHSFKNIYKFICWDTDLKERSSLEDVEQFNVKLRINNSDKFESLDSRFNGKKYTSYTLIPENASIQSIEVIVLKRILIEILEAHSV